MKSLRIIPFLVLPLFLANCRMERPSIEGGSRSQLADVAIGNLDKPSWSTFDFQLDRLTPTKESIKRTYKRETQGATDPTVQVAYGDYRMLLTYRDSKNAVVFESCAAEKTKEHKINAPQYIVEIQICAQGDATPVGVVKADKADVNIKPVVIGSGSFVEKHGLLTVANGKIVDKNLQPIQLKGMSFFWSQWSSAFWNKNVVATLKNSWKATLIRAAMGVEEGGYLTQPAVEKERVKTVVNEAISQGLYVIIDWHDHNATAHTQKAVEFFSEMAELYGNQPNVIFEVFNEPTSQSWEDVKTYAETVIKAIRAKNAKNLVIVGSPTWSQRVDLAADNPVQDSNVAYTLHFYSGTHRQDLRDKATYAIGKGLALFVTEFGVCDASGNGNIDLAEADLWMAFMNKHGISWANWALNDKAESASALKTGASPQGNWLDSDLTESGAYIKRKLLEN